MTQPDPTGLPPKLLFLPSGDALFLDIHKEGLRCIHTGSGDEAWLTGDFADALVSQTEAMANDRQHALLTRLGHSHPWLQDVSVGTSTPPSFAGLLLGQGLGMLFIELTARCNERCLHCYAESAPERSEQLSLDEVRRVLTEAMGLGNPAVQFTGGDPLTYPHLPEAVETARELGYGRIEIYTNGLLLDEAMLERLKPYAPDLAFSLYSHDAATHDGITRLHGSHKKTITAIRRATQAGYQVRVGVVLMPENQGHERHIPPFLQRELGLEPKQISFDTVKGTGRGSFAEYEPDFGDIPTGAHITSDEPDESPSHTGRKGKLCIASDGCVYPCIFSRGTVLGSIRKQPLEQIMAELEVRALPPPSARRWSRCRQQMTCQDCRIIAYALGTDNGEA